MNAHFHEYVKSLLSKYETKEKSGILFKLEREKNPLEIIGVLDFLKFKIESWGNTNLFSYMGSLFDDDTILVIGSPNSEEAISIIKFVYLSQLIKSEYRMEKLKNELKDNNDLELFLGNKISKDIKEGFPSQPKIEKKIKDHLNSLLTSGESSK
ncbi:MAG: hypothetical protein ACFFEN_02550 [Candidatus Thorarchaeota archaeon]